ncbi:type III pantothenate kinase [Candidatus Pelagibacter sp.]|nr:type III pantothenate kinase [Candidatus Pelagibacter sp.]
MVINNVYNGGVIAPGVDLSLYTLIKKASLIPSMNLKKTKKVIGRNTINAVRSGFFWGYAGLIDNIVDLIMKETKKKFKVIITGGYSKLFTNSLKSKVIIDKDITIKGLIRTIRLIDF